MSMLQLSGINDIFADVTIQRTLSRRTRIMGLFDTEDQTAVTPDEVTFDDKDKVRLFETERNRGGSGTRYIRKFLPVTLIVIAAIAAGVYFLMPGTGDEIQGSTSMRRSVYDHMLTKAKRTANEITFYKCDGYFWAKVLAEPKPYPPSLILDDVNQFRLRVTKTGKETFQSETLPLPARPTT